MKLRPERPGLLVRLFAFLRGGTVVQIEDFQGRVLTSIARKGAFGGMWCPVYWFTNVGHCLLLPDGKVDPKSESSYVLRWRYADPQHHV